MSRVLIIGCGAVASVAIHKCCAVPEVFSEICIASRHRENCEAHRRKAQTDNEDGHNNGKGRRVEV